MSESQEEAACSLHLSTGDHVLYARGSVRLGNDDGGEGAVVGAFPFSPAAHGGSLLFRPEGFECRSGGFRTAASVGPTTPVRVTARPSRREYTNAVTSLVEALRAHRDMDGPLKKVVLARRLDISSDHPIDVDLLAQRLDRDPNTTTFLLNVPGSEEGPARSLVGATPELLVEKAGARVLSVPLAGSAPRRAGSSDDRAVGEALLASAKDREEHRLVVEYVMDTLSPLCTELRAPESPALSCTESMWHLSTRVAGRLRDASTPSLRLARLLHPTPAVCGVPSDEAARLISELEPVERGLYGGAVGWCDDSGDGKWMVTLRCALVSGSTASLYAGAGIVADSDPEAECEETSAKFGALLTALGITESGAPEVPLGR